MASTLFPRRRPSAFRKCFPPSYPHAAAFGPASAPASGAGESTCFATSCPPALATTETATPPPRPWPRAVQSRSAPAGGYRDECGSCHPPADLRIGEWTLDLLRLQLGGLGKVCHLHRRSRFGREEGRIKRYVADVPACHVELRELLRLETARRSRLRKHLAPDGLTLRSIWEGKVHGEAKPALEGRVQRRLQIGRQDGETLVFLHALQQVSDFDVGIAVVTIAYLATLTEQCVGFVEQQEHAALLRRVEDLFQVLFGFTDVLADHCREIDTVEVEPKLPGE